MMYGTSASVVGCVWPTVSYTRPSTSDVHTSLAIAGNQFLVFIWSCPPTVYVIVSPARVSLIALAVVA